MSLSLQFASAVRLHLLGLAPQLTTRIVRDYGRPTHEPYSVRVTRPDGTEAHAGLYDPKDKKLAYVLVLEPSKTMAAWVYTARGDVLPLSHFAAAYILDPSIAPSTLIAGMTTWYTAAAERELPNPHMAESGTLLEVDLDHRPRVSDLFNDRDFWLLLQSLRDNKTCQTTAGVLADFVQERDFHQIAGLLRSDLRAALRVLPTRSATPRRFLPAKAGVG